MSKKIGKLGFNDDNNRYGVLVMDCWEIEGLHCGQCLDVFIDGMWVTDRIEMNDEWYLVYSKLKGEELEGLKVKC